MSMRLIPSRRSYEYCREPYDVRIVASLKDIPATEIEPLTAGRTFYVSRPWLLAIERLRSGGTAYVVYRDRNGRLLGVCPVYWGKPSLRGFYEPFSRFLARSGGAFDECDWLPTYIVGSRAAYACEFLVAPNLEAMERAHVLATMLDVAQEHATACGAASISSLYLNERGRQQLEEVVIDGTDFFVAGANTVLDVRWERFEEYVAEMKNSIRREMRVFSSRGYRIVSCKLADSVETLAELFARLERKYGHCTSPEEESRELRILADVANDLSLVLLLKLGERVVGGVLLFLWEDTIYARSAGFDYEVTGKCFEYFNLVFYEPIRFAIENGYKHIDLGMASYRAKLARGARLEPLWGVIASRTAPSPFRDPQFAAWNRLRYEAVQLGDPTLLEMRDIP